MVYVVLDGPDGGGKSTQAGALCAHLRGRGRTVAHLREPGSTPVGEALRALLLAPATGELLPLTEALLFSAARAQLVHTAIRPALQRGEDVVVERCWVATVVYQALAPEPGAAVERDWLLDLTRRVHGDCLPDAVFVLDVDPAVARARCGARAADRIEARDAAFHARVRAGYREIAALDPAVHLVEAGGDEAAVRDELLRRLVRWVP